MKIAVASGKGGVGKTTVSVALAMAGADMGRTVTLADCDVEEPNGHLSLTEIAFESVNAFVGVPTVAASLCDGCGKCSEICHFSAILTIREKAIPFNSLCHSCLGCLRVCPQGAIEMIPRKIGTVNSVKVASWKHTSPSLEAGSEFSYLNGVLDVGNPMSPPLIKKVLQQVASQKEGTLTIIDAPPGTSCPMVSSVESSDVVLLVAEPTVFGLNDLQLAIETVRLLGKPFTVLINRFVTEDNPVTRWCNRSNVDIIHEIDFSLETAASLSEGTPLLSVLPQQQEQFERMITQLEDCAGGGRPS
jgi:MinD superfamily P-loop ATPase